MDRLDPARTALLVVHMAEGVAGQVDTPFDRLFKQRAEKTGSSSSGTLLNGFRTAKAKVVYTLVTYQLGLPGVKPNSPLFRTYAKAGTVRALATTTDDRVVELPDVPPLSKTVPGYRADAWSGLCADGAHRSPGTPAQKERLRRSSHYSTRR